VFSDVLAEAQSRQFDADLARSRRVTLRDWRRRPLSQRIQEALVQVLYSQL